MIDHSCPLCHGPSAHGHICEKCAKQQASRSGLTCFICREPLKVGDPYFARDEFEVCESCEKRAAPVIEIVKNPFCPTCGAVWVQCVCPAALHSLLADLDDELIGIDIGHPVERTKERIRNDIRRIRIAVAKAKEGTL